MPIPRSFLSLQSFLRLVLPVSCSLVSMAMAGSLRADEIPCAGLISTAELRAASGIGFDLIEKRPANPAIDHQSHSSCKWEAGDDSETSVTIEFWDVEAIRKDPYGGGTVSGFFDMFVSSRQSVSDAKPQTLEGIGIRAVLFVEAGLFGELWIVQVELPHGMAYLRATGLSRKQVQAIARVAGALKQ